MLTRGLMLAGFSIRTQQKSSRLQNLRCFTSNYGSLPIVYAAIWEDLQMTDNPEARIDAKKADVDSFFLGIHFLKVYPRRELQAGLFKICEKTAAHLSWFFSLKIQALKNEKVSGCILPRNALILRNMIAANTLFIHNVPLDCLA